MKSFSSCRATKKRHTHGHTHIHNTHTYTDIFWKHLIFYVDHMCARETVNIELRILPPNQCFTQSKIEKERIPSRGNINDEN